MKTRLFLENTAMVIKNRRYLAAFAAITGFFAFLIGSMMQVVFIFNGLIFNLGNLFGPIDAIFLVFMPLMSGFTITLMLYRLMELRYSPLQKGAAGGIFGALVGIFSSACTCSIFLLPVLAFASSIGLVGLFPYVSGHFTEIRIITMALLAFSLYITAINLTAGCKIKDK